MREWRLEAWQAPSEGRELWLDRDTGMVYQPAGSKEEGWPALLGARTADGSVYRLESTLSEYLKPPSTAVCSFVTCFQQVLLL